MIGLVLVTHGHLAEEFIRAMEHVVGTQEQIVPIAIGPDDDMEGRRRDIIAACPGAVEIDGRGEAIAVAIAELRDDDLLLIAGRGHEQGQSIAGQMIPFDDGEVARRAVLAQSRMLSRISP